MNEELSSSWNEQQFYYLVVNDHKEHISCKQEVADKYETTPCPLVNASSYSTDPFKFYIKKVAEVTLSSKIVQQNVTVDEVMIFNKASQRAMTLRDWHNQSFQSKVEPARPECTQRQILILAKAQQMKNMMTIRGPGEPHYIAGWVLCEPSVGENQGKTMCVWNMLTNGLEFLPLNGVWRFDWDEPGTVVYLLNTNQSMSYHCKILTHAGCILDQPYPSAASAWATMSGPAWQLKGFLGGTGAVRLLVNVEYREDYSVALYNSRRAVNLQSSYASKLVLCWIDTSQMINHFQHMQGLCLKSSKMCH
uniref:Uncharacterized protein n=1 Tax=Romanomermis culicivorax TaxID=13658 RepID=A0A915JTZ0_ROMCU